MQPSPGIARGARVVAQIWQRLGVLAALILLVIAASFLSHRFLTVPNLMNVLRQVSIVGILAIGMTFVILTRGIDLSVGSIFALQGVMLYIMLREWHWPWPIAAAAILAGAAFLGAIHAFLITKMRLQPFIVTLCAMLIYRSIARYAINDASAGFGAENFGIFRALASGKVGIPLTSYIIGAPFIALIVVAVIMWVVLHRSVFGRYLFAVGRNELLEVLFSNSQKT